MLVSCSAATSSTPAMRMAARGAAHSYIVEAAKHRRRGQGRDSPPAAKSSRASNVIDAVEANLTDAQHARVLAATGIKQITTNTIVTTQAAANVRDNFELGSFANNDGTHRWYGDWVEQNDDNNPHGGDVTVGWHDRGGNRLILRR